MRSSSVNAVICREELFQFVAFQISAVAVNDNGDVSGQAEPSACGSTSIFPEQRGSPSQCRRLLLRSAYAIFAVTSFAVPWVEVQTCNPSLIRPQVSSFKARPVDGAR